MPYGSYACMIQSFCCLFPPRTSPREVHTDTSPGSEEFCWTSGAIFNKSRTKSVYFYQLMIYFVLYVFGPAKRGRENSENGISDDLETLNFWHFSAWRRPRWDLVQVMQPFSNVLPSFPCNYHLQRKCSPCKNNTLQSGPGVSMEWWWGIQMLL